MKISDRIEIEQNLKDHVEQLATTIGERNLWHFDRLEQTARYVEEQMRKSGYEPQAESYEVEGKTCRNIVIEKKGVERPGEIVLIGAHYDTVPGSPGANDNASGVAALLEIAHLLAEVETRRTLRLVAFVNEEPPFFQTDRMGSRLHARRSVQRGDNIVAMISLETIGYYSDEKGSQDFPSQVLRPFYPDSGNFLAFVGNLGSRRAVDNAIEAFRRHCEFPAEALIAPGWLTGVDWSDHWSFWEEDYPALMVTDTAPFRYPHYHSSSDTADKLDYNSLSRVTKGLAGMALDLSE
ncbi:MAG: M20/M25/M40 family metallo-hydrolase [Desulfuromonadales bacterium]